LIHKLFENSQRLIREIVQNFIKPAFLEDICNLNLDNEEIRQALKYIYVDQTAKIF